MAKRAPTRTLSADTVYPAHIGRDASGLASSFYVFLYAFSVRQLVMIDRTCYAPQWR